MLIKIGDLKSMKTELIKAYSVFLLRAVKHKNPYLVCKPWVLIGGCT